MHHYQILLFYISYMVLIMCTAQITEKTIKCTSKTTCGECIRLSQCFWNITSNESNCNNIGNEKESAESINPKTSGNITDTTPTDHLNIREIDLKIRPGTSYSFDFRYTHKKQYPVDIYFLMDMSKSMQGYRSKISILAAELFQAMKKKSDEVFMGFGSFVDKTSLPYVNTAGNKIINTCREQCALPYSFKNHLKLTANVDEFSSKVNNTPISANIDGPEGSLEALLQAIVCTKEIGWRDKARHLIILSTDDAFHVAGDGKLAGIVDPNDGECHLENDQYTHGLLHDYPSIGQIREKAGKHGMNILYVVTPSQEKLYGKLQDAIKNSYLGTLQANSDNIVNLVENFYDNITASATINHNFHSNNFNIKIIPKNCPKFQSNICSEIHNNGVYDFTVTIEFNRCPDNKNYIRNYYVKPHTLSEQINIKVEMFCDCPCEHEGNKGFEKMSESCSNSGDLQCGVCICKPEKVGSQCQCNKEDISAQQNVDDNSDCRRGNSTIDCSGNGQCKCGTCTCSLPFSGKHCECNEDLCVSNKDTKEICFNHGQCECGSCKCHTDWTGSHCDCSTNNDTCKQQENNEICSGKGNCTCGKCICYDKEKYGGKYCEECKTCPKTCSDFENCVRCHYNKCEEKCAYQIDETGDRNTSEVDKLCSYQHDKCLIQFSFHNESGKIYTKKNCTITQAGIYSLLSFIVLGILLLGLLILAIWKLYIELQYRKEYAKFVHETNNPQWNAEVNPLFKKPVSEFQNPLYKKSN